MVTPGSKFTGGREKRDFSKDGRDRRSQFKVDHRPKTEDALKKDKEAGSTSSSGQIKTEPKTLNKEARPSKFEPRPEDNGKDQKRLRKDGDEHDKESRSKREEANKKGKFTGRCRLFIGNVPIDTTEKEFISWFKPFGECSEVFLNPNRGFGFIRMESRAHAETAKKGVDGLVKRGKTLRARMAAHVAALRVKFIHPFVSNELLHEAFSLFGDVERAVVAIDDKGKTLGEGIVEFTRKPSCMQALKRVNEGIFLLGSSPRPVVCELLEQRDEEDGLPEQFVIKSTECQKEREEPPRFASSNTFEYNFAQKWKAIYNHHDEQKKMLEAQFQDAVSKLEMEESNARMEHETQMLREDLMRRQEELRQMEERHKMEIQRRMDTGSGQRFMGGRQNEDQRRMIDMQQRGMDLRHYQEEAKRQMEEERRREEEARMFMQQEMAMRQMQQEERGRGSHGGGPQQGGNSGPMQPPPAPPLGGGQGPNLRGQRGDPGEMVQRGGQMGMQQAQHMQQQQGMALQQQQQQMGGMRGRKGDSDYRQSRFDQPPQQFPGGNQQQMGGGGGPMMNPQMQMGGHPMGGAQMPMSGAQMGMGGAAQMNPQMAAAQQMGMGAQMMPMGSGAGGPMQGMHNANMPGGGGAVGNQGNMQGGAGNPGNMERGGVQAGRKHMSERQEGGRGDSGRDDYYESKRSRRY